MDSSPERSAVRRQAVVAMILVSVIALLLALMLARRDSDFVSPTLLLPVALILAGVGRALAMRRPKASRAVLLAAVGVVVLALASLARRLLG